MAARSDAGLRNKKGGFVSRVYFKIFRNLVGLAVAGVVLGLLSGCASTGVAKDPLEGYNRAMFAFNDGIDRAVLRPVAQGYADVVPGTLRTGVSNFYGNIADVFIAANNLLQGKLPEAAGDIGRVAVNTTMGLLGVIDFASDFGLEKHDEDFGQTFGRWGSEPGPYFVIPILGPSTVRDTVGTVLDFKLDPMGSVIEESAARNLAYGLIAVDRRKDLLDAQDTIEALSFDKYTGVRGAWLARRRSQVYDGDPPPRPTKDD